jgi:phage FluMu protein Com
VKKLNQKIKCEISNCEKSAVMVAKLEGVKKLVCETHYLISTDLLKKVLAYLKKDCPHCKNPMSLAETDIDETHSDYYFQCYDCDYEEKIKDE